MLWLRSFLFNLSWAAYTVGIGLLFSPALLMPKAASRVMSRLWARGSLFLLRLFCGISHEVRGREHIPAEPHFYACKHQSAWETIAIWTLLPRPIYVLKRSLLFLPVFGIYLWKLGMIAIDRKAGTKALKQIIREGKARMAEGHNVLIYPEGTRVPIGHHQPYQPGIAALYKESHVPVVPIALNSGLFWRRNAFVKQPGHIIVEFLPPVAANLPRREFMALLQERIETATARLVAEAQGARA